MANEINLSINFQVQKNGAGATGTLGLVQDMAGDQFLSNIQIVGTTNEALIVGDVTATGWQFIKNLDAANYIEIFLNNDNTGLVAKLLPGEATLIKPGAGVFGRANTAPVSIHFFASEL